MIPLPIVLSFSLPAAAFVPQVPTTDSSMDASTVQGVPSRILYDHPQVQAGFFRSDAWQRFAATDGAGWNARFDETTGTPRYLWGRGISVPVGSASQVTAAVEAIVERHADLLGFEPGALTLDRAEYNQAYDTWYVSWKLVRDGVAVYHEGVAASVKHGNLVMLSVQTAPNAEIRGGFALSADRAIDLAIAEGPAPTATHTERTAEPTLVEVFDTSGLHLQKAWLVQTRTYDPPGKWIGFVDAESGSLLYVYNQVLFATGTITGLHHTRTVDGTPLVEDPIPLVNVENDAGDTVATDANGDYTIPDGATYTTQFQSDYLTIKNQSGPEGVLTSDQPDMLWDGTTNTVSEPNTWIAVHHVRDWAAALDPTLRMVVGPITATVNIPQNCNSYYDGDLHYFHAGGPCNNSGEINDVIWHEWGHGFHESSILSGTFDPSLSEGAADTVAFIQTQDSQIGPYFFKTGAPVRDVSDGKVYPDDYNNPCPFGICDPHANGEIFAGAMWDLMQELEARDGVAAGTDLISHLHAGLLKSGPDIPGSYYAILLADDDDGDLQNGTPNQCEIMDAFGKHGLVGFTLAATHEPLVTVPDDQPADVSVQVVSTTGNCASTSPVSATVHYRVDGGAWQDVTATIDGNKIDGSVPPQPLGSFVEYYLDGVDTLGVTFQAPTKGEIAPYTYYSGDTIPVHCDDFDADDGGYTHQLISGTGDPADEDWQWGAPQGLGGDPAAAYSGDKAWGNDLDGDGFYNPSVTNELTSPDIATTHFKGVFLQYRRWLGVEDAKFDTAAIFANDKLVWSNYKGKGTSESIDDQWISHSVDLKGQADQGTVHISFGIQSDPGLQMGGWTVDDVCLMAPATADNRMGIDDFTATDIGGPIKFEWTTPTFGPIQQIAIVKRADRYPAAHDDGTTVATVDNPALGSATEAQDDNTDGSSGYYAAYGFDGTEWSTVTIEGLNAAHVDPNGGDPGTSSGTNPSGTNPTGTNGDGDGKGGCGCDAAPTTAGWLAIPLLGLMIRRRRT